eukprot:scaffold32195_cov122-Isochrysis_galbana.AAC.1
MKRGGRGGSASLGAEGCVNVCAGCDPGGGDGVVYFGLRALLPVASPVSEMRAGLRVGNLGPHLARRHIGGSPHMLCQGV